MNFHIFLTLLIGGISCAVSTKIPSDVIELNDKFLDVMDEGFWFVEFYAPWCAHCKRLAPIWEHVAHMLADRNSPVRVGKVDCTRFPGVASALKIHGYPTVIFFRNGIQKLYEGERRKEDLVKFAEKSSGPIVDELESTAQFSELLKHSSKDPFFMYLGLETSTKDEGQSKDLYTQFLNASERLFTEVRFLRATSPSILPPQIAVSGVKVVVFKDRIYKEFNVEKGQSLDEWIRRERWPQFPHVSSNNIHAIAESSAKKLVLVVIDMVDRLNTSTQSGSFFVMAKQAAEELSRDEDLRELFQFGWLDGNSMANSIVMGQLSVPNVFVFNLSSYEFYLSDDAPGEMTAQSLITFLQTIAQGNVEVQGGRAWITRIRRMFYDISTNIYDMFYHQPILTVCLFGVPLAFFSIITYSICSADFSVDRDEVYPADELDDDDDAEDDDNESGIDEAAPMLLGEEHQKAE